MCQTRAKQRAVPVLGVGVGGGLGGGLFCFFVLGNNTYSEGPGFVVAVEEKEGTRTNREGGGRGNGGGSELVRAKQR